MANDPWTEPEAQVFIEDVLSDMVPKMADSAIAVSLVLNPEGDVKFWVELGAMIMMDKPIIAVLGPGQVCPRKLALIADEIVACPDGMESPRFAQDLQDAMKRVMDRVEAAETEREYRAGAVVDDGLRSCRGCLWDITQDIETRRWRLGWGGVPDDVDPFKCEGSSDHIHLPMEEKPNATA